MSRYNYRILTLLFILFFLQQERASAQCKATIGSGVTSLQSCDPFTVQFKDISQGTITQRTWDFGDGSLVSNAQNPVHTFITGKNDTTYTVTLSIQCLGGGTSTATSNVKVFSKPDVDFSSDTTTICALSDSVRFVNLSETGVGNTYLWNFGDNTSSTAFQPYHIYSTSSIYTVSLTVKNGNGCQRTLQRDNFISAIQPPSPAFSMSSFIGCDPFTISLTNTTTSTDSISGWLWNYGDGTPTSTLKDPVSHIYEKPDTFFTTLTATNSLGCFNNTTQVIVVKETPKSTFDLAADVCLGVKTSVVYTGTSNASADYLWVFGGGTIVSGSGRGPYVIKWDSSGVKTVSLTVTVNGCFSTTVNSILIHPLPNLTLTSSAINDSLCKGDSIVFNVNPFLYPNYKFYKNGSLVQNTASYLYNNTSLNNNDIISANVTDVNGCASSSPGSILVHVKPTPNVSLTSSITTDSTCSGDTIVFRAKPKGYDNYAFYDNFALIQNGKSDSLVYANLIDGHAVKVVATQSGCLSNNINGIKTSVITSLSPPQVNCGTSTNSSIEFKWDAVSGAIAYQVSIGGRAFVSPSSGSTGLLHLLGGFDPGDSASVQVKAIGAAPCYDTLMSPSTKCYALPCTAITYNTSGNTSVCKGAAATVSISDISTASYSVSWNGGAATTKTAYTFVPVSDTVISVAVTDLTQASCKPVVKYFTITVNPIPLVAVSSSLANDTSCQGSVISFTASPATYENYKFYDGFALVQDGANPVYSTTQWVNGHVLKVTVSDKGCSGFFGNPLTTTILKPLTPPQVNCGTTNSTSIQFSWDAVPGAKGYQVSVNGGSFINPSSGAKGLTHLISGLTQGVSATLVVEASGSGPCGNSSFSLPVTCYTQPCNALSLTVSGDQSICEGDSVVLLISNISASKYAVSWDGAAYSSDTSYTFSESSSGVVSVSVKDSAQLLCPVITKYFNITIVPIPVASITSSAVNDSICKGEAITFSATPGTYDNYKFYDGFALVQDTANPSYTTTSLVNGHTLKVIASNLGCAGTVSNSITTKVINPLLAPQVNCGTTTNSSITYTWDNVVGAKGYQVSVGGRAFVSPSSGANGLSHTLGGFDPGDIATLSVVALGVEPCGLSLVSSGKTCTAIPCTAITFDASANPTICAGDSATLSVSNISASSYSVSWNGAAPTNSTSYKLKPLSDTTISVTVTDLLQLACQSVTKYFYIKVNAIPFTTLTSSDANDSICAGEMLSFTASPAIYSNYTFYNGVGVVQNSANPVYKVNTLTDGNTIRVLATESGCTSSSNSIATKVMTLPVVSLSSSSLNDSACQTSNLVFTATPKGYMKYVFYYNGNPIDAGSQNTYTFNNFPVGNNNKVEVLATDSFACTSVASNTITTTILPYTPVTLTSSLAIACQYRSVTFTALPAGLLKYQFYKGLTEVQNTANNIYTTNNLAAKDTLTVLATNKYGCVSPARDSISVTILPVAPPLLSVDSVALCNGESTKISISVDTIYKNVSYSWSTGATNSTITVTPSTNTMYYITTKYNGCVSNKDSILVQVDKVSPPVADAGSDVTICIGDSIQLNAKGGLYFEWLPIASISNAKIKNPYVNPLVTTQYQVKVSNLACRDSDVVTIIVDRCLADVTAPIPQIITPNGDGSNENWEIPDMDYFTNNSLTIYNRWGNVVYTVSPYNNTWKGQSNDGKELADGVYYYILDLGNNAEKKHTGYIVINR